MTWTLFAISAIQESSGDLFETLVRSNHVSCAFLAENPSLVKTSFVYDTVKMPRHDFLTGSDEGSGQVTALRSFRWNKRAGGKRSSR